MEGKKIGRLSGDGGNGNGISIDHGSRIKKSREEEEEEEQEDLSTVGGVESHGLEKEKKETD